MYVYIYIYIYIYVYIHIHIPIISTLPKLLVRHLCASLIALCGGGKQYKHNKLISTIQQQ